ncbi:MAG: hypothetical protein EOP04_28455 [Proteobacteria bacterium]|nr:MAG: hypothetical protein EOP04_28455 [Pseudomonadota bacterium]
MNALREDQDIIPEGTTYRTDKLENKVRIPPGYGFRVGPDGVGVAIGPCDAAKQDRRGRLHSVPRGYELKIGRNGKGLVVAQGDPTTETKDGQIELIKKPNASGKSPC